MKELRQRTDLHLARRIWHFCGVMSMVALYAYLSRAAAMQVALQVSIVWIGADFLRLYVPSVNRALTWAFGPFMRESERHQIAGTTYLLAGVTLIIVLFPKEVVLLSLLFLAVADPLASYVGIRYGKDKLIAGKSLQGTLAAFGACLVLSIIYLAVMQLMPERLVIVALLAALIGAISELVPIAKLDDNFTFPVLSASLLTLVFELFGGLTP
jgi:diacylglycerol kinase (CTP)